MTSELDLIVVCQKNDRKGQQRLFDLYKRRVMGICLRYASDKAQADDIFQEAFIKIFNSLLKENAREIKSLEAWICQITKNTAITFYHKQKHDVMSLNELTHDEVVSGDESALEKLNSEELVSLIRTMPLGYRMVFNLFMIEGFNHKEIAEKLSITESASRSQLTRSKSWLKEKLIEKEIVL